MFPVRESLGVFVSVLLLSGSAFAAGADAEVKARAEARGLSGDAVSGLLDALARTREAGLPEQAVAGKVLEGLAKGVPPARIVGAADELRGRLQAADEALKRAGIAASGEARGEALERLAVAAQQAGKDEVVALGDGAKGASLPAFVAAAKELGELKARGLPVAESRVALSALAHGGAAPEQIDRVSKLFDEYQAEGGKAQLDFLDEVRTRAEAHHGLDGMVDPFTDGGEPLHRSREALEKANQGRGSQARPGQGPVEGRPSLEKAGRAGANPGFDPSGGSRKGKLKEPKGPPTCVKGRDKNCK